MNLFCNSCGNAIRPDLNNIFEITGDFTVSFSGTANITAISFNANRKRISIDLNCKCKNPDVQACCSYCGNNFKLDDLLISEMDRVVCKLCSTRSSSMKMLGYKKLTDVLSNDTQFYLVR